MLGHPLHGRSLRVDRRMAPRRDEHVQLVLPDGSSALLPRAWTSLEAIAVPASRRVRFRAVDLRALLALATELAER